MKIEIPRAPVAAVLVPVLEAIESRTRALTAGLSESQLRWRPPGGGWSVGQVLEHLVLTHEPYVVLMRSALERGGERARSGGARPWRPTLLGRIIVRSMAAPRKVKTGRRFNPGSEVGPGSADRLVATVRATADVVRAADGADLRVRFTSPVAAVFRPNLGDAFLLLAVHAQRHLGQIERVLAEPGFPGSAC